MPSPAKEPARLDPQHSAGVLTSMEACISMLRGVYTDDRETVPVIVHASNTDAPVAFDVVSSAGSGGLLHVANAIDTGTAARMTATEEWPQHYAVYWGAYTAFLVEANNVSLKPLTILIHPPMPDFLIGHIE